MSTISAWRTEQASGTPAANPRAPSATASLANATASYNANNRMAGSTEIPSGKPYDASGDALNDGANYYVYDAEGRVCATQTAPYSGGVVAYGYLYDAEGRRVAKGSITPAPLGQWPSCNPATNGFTLTESYVLGQGGERLTTTAWTGGAAGTGTWQGTNVYAGGKLISTYDAPTAGVLYDAGSVGGLHFQLTDPLGTRRVQTNSAGEAELDCQSLPFGDQLNCFPDPNAPGNDQDEDATGMLTGIHFTGKERDAESGLDYFGARYYASSMGRFLSPDWSKEPDTVPYADLHNPQSLNLYSYVNNNPLSKTDDDGHVPCGGSASVTITVTPNGSSMSQSADDCPTSLDLWSFQLQSGYRNFVNNWNQRIDSHQPPPQQNNNQALQDISNIMVGLVPVGLSPRYGWANTAKWRQAVKELSQPGTHETIAGEVPTRAEAAQMIEQGGGKVVRGGPGEPMDAGEEFGHEPGGVSDHTYPHINYETPSGVKATVKVQP